jgi:hypothetical protein
MTPSFSFSAPFFGQHPISELSSNRLILPFGCSTPSNRVTKKHRQPSSDSSDNSSSIMPPLVLRLFHANDGGQEMYLVTSLSVAEMNDEELESVY